MPLPPDATDADLASRAATADHRAVDALWARHADAVHDHVARWCADADLAAAATVAAFTALLDDLAADTVPTAVLPTLLRAARSHVLTALATPGSAGGTPVARGVLVRAGDDATTPAAASTAWDEVVELGTPHFSVLDLHVRRGLSGTALATVLALPVATADEQLATAMSLADDTTRSAYAALVDVPAPVAARTTVAAAAVTRLGRPLPLRRVLWLRAAAVIGAMAVVVLGVGLAASTARRTPPPTAGVETAAAEPVAAPSPSPGASPSPTPTLEPLDETTAPPAPTAAPEPSPTPPAAPPPPDPLTVTIDAPGPGTAVDATEQDAADRQVARVPVSATPGGGAGPTAVVWTSDRAPEAVLLVGAVGEVSLWLEEPCIDTPHVLTVTATDETTGEVVTASVDVLARETCEEPPTASITTPTDGAELTAVATEAGFSVTFDVAASSTGEDLAWAWTVDGVPVDVPGPTGQVELGFDSCTERSVTLAVDVTRAADEATATASATLTIVCPA